MSTRNERMGDKALNDRHTKILKALMQRADNRRCADCHKTDPRWASWNLGIFMCIRCSGIHRSLGTHISKVKSADLDSWTTEQIENMARWGNGKANMYWEAQMPPGMEPPEHAIEQWIRAKYERKQYAKPGSIPDPDTLPLPEGVADVKIPGTKKAVVTTSPATTDPPANLISGNNTPQQSVPQHQTAATDFFGSFQSVAVASAPPQPQQQSLQQPIPQQQHDPKAAIMSLFHPNNSTDSVNSVTSAGSGSSGMPPFSASGNQSMPKGVEFLGMKTASPPPMMRTGSNADSMTILGGMGAGAVGNLGTATGSTESMDAFAQSMSKNPANVIFGGMGGMTTLPAVSSNLRNGSTGFGSFGGVPMQQSVSNSSTSSNSGCVAFGSFPEAAAQQRQQQFTAKTTQQSTFVNADTIFNGLAGNSEGSSGPDIPSFTTFQSATSSTPVTTGPKMATIWGEFSQI
ncbi:hypothetical protein SeMB42_g04046 [Synchytrium endobioticum]|uniref:Arf-GAP domain-containing protein n=1 Tax=Synchytrium endobioticum TaxID=286115 RepID=A0A507DHX9_9FUNG|nr:hypothetical protein SeMB42_g04046 [Synchytrium endobioticum]TPX51011.1 hypothetical protein SeLEV6574_g00597 [Synchytrium endobioticum]